MRVLTDVAAIDREFDYAVPAAWHGDGRAGRLAVGTMVRVALQGRRVGGWITECDPEPEVQPARILESGPDGAPGAGTDSHAGPAPSAGARPGSTPDDGSDPAPELRLGLLFDEGAAGGPEGGTPPGGVRSDPIPDAGDSAAPELRPLAKLVGVGPSPELLNLARWAARRWVGRRATFFGTASPPRVVEAVPAAPAASSPVPAVSPEPGPATGTPAAAFDAGSPEFWDAAFDGPVSVVRIAPAADRGPLLAAALRRGEVLLIAPHVADAARLADWVRRRGVTAALLPDRWAQAAAGGVVIGTRAAVFGPAPRLAAVVVLDEHDESLVAEDAPTWGAREVAVERARRAGVPCVLVSPIPTLEARLLASGPLVAPPRHIEREGWPTVEVVDQRDPEVGRHGLLSEVLAARLRSCGRAVCVLNRRGRARLLACGGCGELVLCDSCGAVVGEHTATGTAAAETPAAETAAAETAAAETSAARAGRVELACRRCGERRPRVCAGCGATRLRTLRPGVTKLRDELEILLGEPVAESSGTSRSGVDPAAPAADSRVVIGTEAALHRVPGADLVAFLDFDQELSAPRYRANEQAMALLARAARLVGPRSAGGRILVQTRQPDHPVVEAARTADPDLLSRHDRRQREQLGLPPFGALAEVAGAAAPAFVERLGRPAGLEVSALDGGRWVVRATDRTTLLEALRATERPPGRLRLAVDPLRL